MKKIYYLIPFFIILFSVNILIFNESFYLDHNSGVNFYEEEVGNLLGYFSGGELNEERYSVEEVIHLKDVRNIIYVDIGLACLFFILISFGLYKSKKSDFKEIFLKGGAYGIGLSLLISFLFVNFSLGFKWFHKILFRNGYWILPADSTLIQMFPESFFISASLRIVLYSLIFSSLLLIISRYLQGDKNDRTKKSYNL
ncbi:MAG: DUF1461 domain-containing protein [Nanoarchaeota archaeon]|nr:DUF1461 domain-containing protein [Nanoarchaeota archaeon]